jgi:hypothetical protein
MRDGCPWWMSLGLWEGEKIIDEDHRLVRVIKEKRN